MTTLKEEASNYETKETLNIADLDKFSINIELQDGTGTDKEGNPFSYKYTVIEGKHYRVAGSIIGGVKALLNKMPNLEYVSVIKQGTGMNTKYTVVPFN